MEAHAEFPQLRQRVPVRSAQVPGFPVAGKTGTAQKNVEDRVM